MHSLSEEIAEIEEKLRIGKELPYEIVGLKERQVLAISRIGRKLFESERFEEACEIFFLLTILDPENRLYWISLGMCEHNLENYEAALVSYYTAICIGHRKPEIYFHCAQCMFEMKEHEGALVFLDSMKEAGIPTESNQEYFTAAAELEALVRKEIAA